MSFNRIQKLLFSEYCDFEDMVLVESPFAQTTRDGQGLRQVQLGLTPTKFILATDIVPSANQSYVNYISGIDPDIETCEIISIYPVDCVNISIYRRRKRQALKAHLCNNCVYYFELGGFEKRSMFWNLWCEKVKFLSPENLDSSVSETSVATSTTNSTLYLIDSKEVLEKGGIYQIWCKYDKSPSSTLVQKWTDRYLYLGKFFDDWPTNYKPKMQQPSIVEFLSVKTSKLSKLHSIKSDEISKNDSCLINRFGSGIKENCSTGLFLPADECIFTRKFSQLTNETSGLIMTKNINYQELAESCVRQWEHYHELKQIQGYNIKHRRRFGISPKPLFLHGLGPWEINKGAKYSSQMKRAGSSINIRKMPTESDLRLSLTKRQLVATVSCDSLNKVTVETKLNYIMSQRNPVIFFWTSNYWYRPRSAKDAYLELQNHLKQIRVYQHKCPTNKKKKRFFNKKSYTKNLTSNSDSDESYNPFIRRKRKSKMSFNVFTHNSKSKNIVTTKRRGESQVQYLQRILHMTYPVTIWDLNSTKLAQQLTLIDRDLFIKIDGSELKVLLLQQTAKNAPNFGAMVAFSHRISCLVASEILKNNTEEIRAKIIARFIKTAHKCHCISNFHSCKSILFGLQSPAIYRLERSWAYIRKRHATKYQIFEYLSRLYRDPRLLSYQRAFSLSSQNAPHLPFIGDIIDRLLDRIPNYNIKNILGINESKSDVIINEKKNSSNMLTKLLMAIKLLNGYNNKSILQENNNKNNKIITNTLHLDSPIWKPKGLCDYYKPLNYYEDNRNKTLRKTCEFLKECQLSAINYSFPNNSIANDYLLKVTYNEDIENFYNSLKVEPNHFKY